MNRISNFTDFWPYYLSLHKNKMNRILHFIGTILCIIFFFVTLLFQKWNMAILTPFIGYSFAWVGHFFYEKNKPATFDYFLWSLLADLKMMLEILKKRSLF